MFYFMHVLHLFLVILLELKESEEAGVIEIKFIEYVNTNGFKTGNPSQCCDVPSSIPSQCKADPCDPIFDICLQNISSSGCEFGRQTTGYVANRNIIRFNKSIGANNTSNPLRFPVSEFFHNQVILTLTVYDEDRLAGHATNDKIDYMQQVVFFTPDVNGTRSTVLHYNLTGVSSSLSVEMNIRCGTFYFGTSCKKRCRPTKPSQTCSSDGSKSCLPGYTGVQCGTNIDDCVSHICQNGATCQDGVNNYTCKCMSGFTGRYCETIITTSTLPTTTTYTSTTVTTSTTSTPPTTTITTTTSTTLTPPTTTTTATTSTTSTLPTTIVTSTPSTLPTTATSTTVTTSATSILPTTTESTTATSSFSSTATTSPTTTTSLPTTSSLPTTFSPTTTKCLTSINKSLPTTTKLFSKTTKLLPTTSTGPSSPMISSLSVTSKSSSTTTAAPRMSTKSSVTSIPTPKPTLRAHITATASTPSISTSRMPCNISNMAVKPSPGNVAVSFSVSGTFSLADFRNYLQKWSQQQVKLTAKTILRSNNILGNVRRLAVNIQFKRTSHLTNDTEKLKNVIKTFCNPHASMYGKNKMPEPAQSGSNPGPVIGGVFGGLAAVAAATVTGFFIYKRKFKPTPSDSNAQRKILTKTENDVGSNESFRVHDDGKSLTETNANQKETHIYKDDIVKEPKTVRHLNLADGMKILDF